MFKVDNVILSDDIATTQFACDLSRCKGACCVVGDAGAPVDQAEVPNLRKAYRQLKDRLRPRAREVADVDGVVKRDGSEYELNCTDNRECIFVVYDENGVAECAIQKAYLNGEFDWEKPISCHLFPVRLKKVGGFEYANYEYVPKICSPACDRGEREGIYLSDFIRKALVRRYGDAWYQTFTKRCKQVRKSYNKETLV